MSVFNKELLTYTLCTERINLHTTLTCTRDENEIKKNEKNQNQTLRSLISMLYECLKIIIDRVRKKSQ